MSHWVSVKPGDDARAAWNALSPETKATLMTIADTESRTSDALRTHLLSEIEAFVADEYIKEPFKKAILNVHVAIGEPCPVCPRQ
jgi:hypothetical protein